MILKSFFLCLLAILLSLSILGPSCTAFFEHDKEVEVVQDIEEEKNETKNELEDYEKFFTELLPLSIEHLENTNLASHYYLVKTYGHITDTQAPPPEVSSLKSFL